jgi:hypothetical protein
MRPSLDRAIGFGLSLSLYILATACGGGGGGGVNVPIAVAISPTSATVQLGTARQFTATVTGTTNTAVTWSVNNVTGGNSTVGMISTSGLYTAPDVIPSSNPVTVKATSQADTSKSASASVTLTTSTGASTVPATAGQITTGVDVNLQTFNNPTLGVIALGTCDNVSGSCTAGASGAQVKQGATATLFLVGTGIVTGDSFAVSGNSADIVISNIQFTKADSGEPAATFDIAVSAGAPVGMRNLMVFNTNGEMTAFVGGLEIVSGP